MKPRYLMNDQVTSTWARQGAPDVWTLLDLFFHLVLSYVDGAF